MIYHFLVKISSLCEGYVVKMSRGVAMIGLEQYALSWVEVLRRTNAYTG